MRIELKIAIYVVDRIRFEWQALGRTNINQYLRCEM